MWERTCSRHPESQKARGLRNTDLTRFQSNRRYKTIHLDYHIYSNTVETTPMHHSLQFDAIAEERPGPKWQARWKHSWPAYRGWFLSRRGDDEGPSRIACETALSDYMPELLPTWRQLCILAGDDDLAARFLSAWCPPPYLGGCSLAAVTGGGQTRLVRNYDLSPDLNEGLLLRSAWTGRPVMGMVEFLWGLSDGINADGLAVALAFGGRETTGRGFGITTILRYVLETCSTVADALAVLATRALAHGL